MLAGCGRSRAVASDSCRIAVSLVEACRLQPGSCCLTVWGPAFTIASLELYVWNLGAGKVVYFKLPKMGYSKKILTHTFGNMSDFHPFCLIDSTGGRGQLRSFTAGCYQFKMIESQLHLRHFFLSQDKLFSFLFRCLFRYDYSEFISQHSKWMLHLAAKYFALDWIMISKYHHIKLVLLSHAVLDDIPSLAVFLVIYQLAELVLPAGHMLNILSPVLHHKHFWLLTDFETLSTGFCSFISSSLARSSHIVAPGVFPNLLCICKQLWKTVPL